MDIKEELKSAGVYPTGPVSAWPKSRHDRLMSSHPEAPKKRKPERAQVVKAGPLQMAKGLARTGLAAATGGKVDKAIRNARYETCKLCPSFIQKSKRCSECGCFMEAKTWINADKAILCPLNKWEK